LAVALTALIASVVVAAAMVLSAASDEIVVTREAPGLPSGCTPKEAAQLLVRFADAVSTGDRAALERVFAVIEGDHGVARPERYFRWYSVSEGREGSRPWRHTSIYDIADLFPYFAGRRLRNERWQIVTVDVGTSWIPGAAGVTYLIRRTADDLPASVGDLAFGKGEIDCTAQRVFVWSMGQDRVTARPPCPLPEGWTLGTSIVACARAGTTGRSANAPAVTSDFRIVGRHPRLPRACASDAVGRRVRAVLSAFNVGKGTAFATRFTSGARFAAGGTVANDRASIAAFVGQRYVRGEGWTARALMHRSRSRSKLRGVPADAVYRLDLLVSAIGQPLRAAEVTFAVECSSGLIAKWSGPVRPTA
jgi:hypothetical protein